MDDCIFCKIARGEAPAKKVYENQWALAFHDLSPQAPAHVLVIPKVHAANWLEAAALDDETLAGVWRAVAETAKALGVDESGFRVVSNCGPDARQDVQHVHLHVLGGRRFSATIQ
ncbi:MAG: histidine triad nucleotide-binding protein [Oscillospiraceae bacterium]|nr:histidine triad nucleotide-binding protein [Oscillospiraceae bacterium]